MKLREDLDWLLASEEPGVVLQARRDLLGDPDPAEAARVLDGPWVRALLAGQQADGGFGVNVYGKWGGAHWRLVSLVELGVPAGEPRCLAAAETVLAWLTGKSHRAAVKAIDGLVRRCGSQEGNALAVCCRLGLAEDPRVRLLAESLVEWQWPDGGWNCDKKASGRRSSFNESLAPMWGLHEYWLATGEPAARGAALRTAELFLDHRLYRVGGIGEPIRESFVALHYPPYWHYDILQALLVLSRMGLAGDPRARDAVELVESRRLPDGRWRAGGRWWKPPGSKGSNVEVVDWGPFRPERDGDAERPPRPRRRRRARQVTVCYLAPSSSSRSACGGRVFSATSRRIWPAVGARPRCRCSWTRIRICS